MVFNIYFKRKICTLMGDINQAGAIELDGKKGPTQSPSKLGLNKARPESGPSPLPMGRPEIIKHALPHVGRHFRIASRKEMEREREAQR